MRPWLLILPALAVLACSGEPAGSDGGSDGASHGASRGDGTAKPSQDEAPAQTATSLPETVTFAEHVAPIVYDNCVVCHRPGESGPFEFLTYDDVRDHAKQIAEVTRSGFMPPWLPAKSDHAFVGARHLEERDITLLEKWVADGHPRGERGPNAPGPRVHRGVAARRTGPRRRNGTGLHTPGGRRRRLSQLRAPASGSTDPVRPSGRVSPRQSTDRSPRGDARRYHLVVAQIGRGRRGARLRWHGLWSGAHAGRTLPGVDPRSHATPGKRRRVVAPRPGNRSRPSDAHAPHRQARTGGGTGRGVLREKIPRPSPTSRSCSPRATSTSPRGKKTFARPTATRFPSTWS